MLETIYGFYRPFSDEFERFCRNLTNFKRFESKAIAIWDHRTLVASTGGGKRKSENQSHSNSLGFKYLWSTTLRGNFPGWSKMLDSEITILSQYSKGKLHKFLKCENLNFFRLRRTNYEKHPKQLIFRTTVY